jgi:hypothetical protein
MIDIDYPRQGFYVPISDAPTNNSSMEEMRASFKKGTDVPATFLLGDSILVTQYLNTGPQNEASFYYTLFNLHSGFMVVGTDHRSLIPKFCDGVSFYQLSFYQKYSDQKLGDFVKNPILLVFQVKRSVLSQL